MIIATIRIVADSENIDKIIEILSSVKGQVAGKTGCISCLILQEVNNGNRISYEELWENQEQFNKHICSNLYQKILVAIDMSSQPPIVKLAQFRVLQEWNCLESVCLLRWVTINDGIKL